MTANEYRQQLRLIQELISFAESAIVEIANANAFEYEFLENTNNLDDVSLSLRQANRYLAAAHNDYQLTHV